MTLDKLQSQEVYKLLTEKEQAFVCNYLLSEGDWADSVRKAYKHTEEKRIRQTVSRLRSRPFILQLIRLIDGANIPTKDDLIHESWSTALELEGGAAKVGALQLTSKLCGYLDGKGEDDKPDLKKLLEEGDKKYAS